MRVEINYWMPIQQYNISNSIEAV